MNQRAVQQNRALEALQAGTYGATGEKLSWVYYDTAPVPAAAGAVQMFQTPISGTKTISETNMVTGGQIPQGQKFVINSIAMAYKSNTESTTIAELNEFYTLLNTAIVQIKISNKAPMLQIKLNELMGVQFMNAAAIAASAALGGISTSQANIFTGVWKLKTPIVIGSLTPFAVELIFPTAPATSVQSDIITASLRGTLIRAL